MAMSEALPTTRAPARWQDFLQLLKPRVMSLVVFTGLTGLVCAPTAVNPILGAVAILCIALSLAAGCRKQAEPEPAALPSPVSEPEATRGLDACQDYREKLCACAEARAEDAELRELCELAAAKRSGLELVLQVNRTTELAAERLKTADTVRRYVRSCIEGIGDLAARGCPR